MYVDISDLSQNPNQLSALILPIKPLKLLTSICLRRTLLSVGYLCQWTERKTAHPLLVTQGVSSDLRLMELTEGIVNLKNNLLSSLVSMLSSQTLSEIKSTVLSYYSQEDILQAKDVLFIGCREHKDIIGEKQRRVNSSGRSEKEAHLQDIIVALSNLQKSNINFAIDLPGIPNKDLNMGKKMTQFLPLFLHQYHHVWIKIYPCVVYNQ